MNKHLKHITESLAPIVGQDKAKENVALGLSSVENGNPAKSILIRGESGLGKTLFLDAIAAIYAALGWFIVRVNCPSEIVGEKFAFICQNLRESLCPIVFIVDEAHRLPKGRVSTQRFHKFVQLATDTRMIGKEISINDGELSVPALNWNKLTFVLATNFASKLEEGKGSTSFSGRFNDLLLESYTRAETDEILSRMIKTAGLNIADTTRGYVASCARGNARPLQQITDKLKTISNSLGDKTTLNREHVMQAIRLSDMFPAGLNVSEIAMLQRAAIRPTRQNVLATMFPNIDGASFRNSLAYLQGRDFLVMGSGGYQITPIGTRYLQETAKLGFKLNRD